MIIAGVDEAGRGPLAGPVVAAVVILDEQRPIQGLADSKKLTAKRREFLLTEIITKARAYGIAHATVEEIDRVNIRNATFLAMQRAVNQLLIKPDQVLVDGDFAPKFPYPARSIIGGDNSVPAISAASILAKVTRDRLMIAYEQEYPGYGFSQHKGYPTAQHVAALQNLGACPIHRLSFAPVRQVNAVY